MVKHLEWSGIQRTVEKEFPNDNRPSSWTCWNFFKITSASYFTLKTFHPTYQGELFIWENVMLGATLSDPVAGISAAVYPDPTYRPDSLLAHMNEKYFYMKHRDVTRSRQNEPASRSYEQTLKQTYRFSLKMREISVKCGRATDQAKMRKYPQNAEDCWQLWSVKLPFHQRHVSLCSCTSFPHTILFPAR